MVEEAIFRRGWRARGRGEGEAGAEEEWKCKALGKPGWRGSQTIQLQGAGQQRCNAHTHTQRREPMGWEASVLAAEGLRDFSEPLGGRRADDFSLPVLCIHTRVYSGLAVLIIACSGRREGGN